MKVRSVAAYSVLILQPLLLLLLLLLLQALPQASAAASKSVVAASKDCLLLLDAAAARARTPAAKVLIFAGTTPSSSRLNLALVVAVELRLRCWRGGYGDTKTTGCQVGLRQALTWACSSIYIGRREFGTSFVCFFFFMFCLVADEDNEKIRAIFSLW